MQTLSDYIAETSATPVSVEPETKQVEPKPTDNNGLIIDLNNITETTSSIQSWFATHPERDDCIVGGFGGSGEQFAINRDSIETDLLTAAIICPKREQSDLPKQNISDMRKLIPNLADRLNCHKSELMTLAYYKYCPATESIHRFDYIKNTVSFLNTNGFIPPSCFVNQKQANPIAGCGGEVIRQIHDVEICKRFEAEYGNYTLSPFLDGVVLDAIRVFGPYQRQGHGSKMLNDIIACARATKTKVYLLPNVLHEADTALTQGQLYDWYARHDFVKCLPIFEDGTRLSYFHGGPCIVELHGYMSLVL